METLADPRDVAALASTCRRLRAASDAPPFGGALWRSLAVRTVGAAAAALHSDDDGDDGESGGGDAAHWRSVVAGALTLDAVHWSRRTARRVQDGVAEEEGADDDAGDAAAGPAARATPLPLRRALARSGHAATDDGVGRVIVTGGVRRDGGTAGALDVVVVDCRSKTVTRATPASGAPSPPPPPASATPPSP
jgi:hypothetical protein